METGIQLIAQERKEQIKKHGFSLKHDRQHLDGSLIDAAIICAANDLVYRKEDSLHGIHFYILDLPMWKLPVVHHGIHLIPNKELLGEERIHQLIVAGALIAAEIDRLTAGKKLKIT